VNKTQGVTVGAILAAGFMMRPTGSVAPGAVPARPASLASATAAHSNAESKDGPWLASCKYWEPARAISGEPKEDKAELTIAVAGKGYDKKTSKDFDVSSQVTEVVTSETENCSGAATNATGKDSDGALARWGIPSVLPSGRIPEIHALIAAVPDTLHTHLALEFDREVDALVQAAGDNGYVPSYFWLPWLPHGTAQRGENSAGKEDYDKRSKREQEPGLIIFKHVPQPSEPDYPGTSYSKVIYVFLVSQTPTTGTDGTQLSRAFLYQSELVNAAPRNSVTFSMKFGDRLDLLGANYSGALASLREGLEQGHEFLKRELGRDLSFEVLGITVTTLGGDVVSRSLADGQGMQFYSFGQNSGFETGEFRTLLESSGYHNNRVALLIEDSTVFGAAACAEAKTDTKVLSQPCSNDFDVIRFPREISLLRNAHPESEEQESQSKSAPSPYLHLSLKDPGSDDGIPQFSPEHMPISQEAQLMAIGRQLQRNNTQFIIIEASDVLDQLFLAQFLHRACPDARIVFLTSDLLLERDTENAPYIGALALTPYSLTSLTTSSPSGSVRAFSDSFGEAYYNAASYLFNNGKPPLLLSNYRNPFDSTHRLHASLWATIAGADGYYPLGIVNECASDSEQILPAFDENSNAGKCPDILKQKPEQANPSGSSTPPDNRPYRYPALSWYVLCIVISLLCLVHTLAISFPNYWSPFTRDLAIAQGDHRHRRSMYIHIGTVILICMAVVTAYPLFPTFRVIHPVWESTCFSIMTLTLGLLSLLFTLTKTWRYLGWQDASNELKPNTSKGEKQRIVLDKNFPWFFDHLASLAALLIPAAWIWICQTDSVGINQNRVDSHVGIFFSYRCLHPLSGVSPLLPMLLVLFGWYLWAVLQTLRLRFSKKTRPYLPGIDDKANPHPIPAGDSSYPLYVSDLSLSLSEGAAVTHLYKNITCLLITREWFKRLIHRPKLWLAPCMLLFYLALYCTVIFIIRIQSPERFLLQPGRLPTLYEALLGTLFFPLIMVAIAGWLRTMLVWSALKRGVLESLEQLPIRYAFNRLRGSGWMVMLRQGGLSEQWRDMARSTESIRQMCHDQDLLDSFDCSKDGQKADGKKTLGDIHTKLEKEITALLNELGPKQPNAPPVDPQCGLEHMHTIEKMYSKFSDVLLSCVLIPYWEKVRTGVVDSDVIDELPIKARSAAKEKEEAQSRAHLPLQLHISSVATAPEHIQVAEEFLAIRYVSLIRAVLVNMRYLLIFISFVFVLTIVAWNSYPFQPRLWVNDAFTGLLLLLGSGVIWVFAQMHRDPILSRITDTNANELGLDFYLRIITFGAAPVLAWLAYQFPEVGGGLFRLIQPSLEVLK